MELVHGGDWAGYRAEFGRDALDFSANVSPLGLPAGVAAAITAALPMADRYPDPLCRELRAKLALHEGVPADHILCGNGAADLIFRLEEGANNKVTGFAHRNGTMNVGEYPVSLYSGQDPDDADEKTQKTESEYRYSRQ